jgi:hypothetical protein
MRMAPVCGQRISVGHFLGVHFGTALSSTQTVISSLTTRVSMGWWLAYKARSGCLPSNCALAEK